MINKIGWNRKDKTLVVEFSNGYRYAYPKVSAKLCNQLWVAPSVGSFFCKKIKNRPFVKLF